MTSASGPYQEIDAAGPAAERDRLARVLQGLATAIFVTDGDALRLIPERDG